MALLTFISDFGTKDHFVAAVKAKVLSDHPEQQIVDISHEVPLNDIGQAAFILKSVIKGFPENTIHIIAVNTIRKSNHFIGCELEGHYFLAPDNGILSLISEKRPDKIVRLKAESSSFPGRDIMAIAANQLLSGSPLSDLGEPLEEMNRLINRQIKATKKQMAGHIVYVDSHGNGITNIEKKVFDILHQDRKFTIQFGREKIYRVHQSMADVEGGDCFVIFNHQGLLEIGIHQGSAQKLLGLHLDSPVTITFDE